MSYKVQNLDLIFTLFVLMRFFIILTFVFLSANLVAQEDSLITLTEFKTTIANDRVGVSFTLGVGSFCYGAQLERTIDTMNITGFQKIGEITGVCGHQDFETSYTLWDENPVPNRTVYYRIITGFIPTSFVSVQFNDFGEIGHRIDPNPWTLNTTITVANKQQKKVEIRIFEGNGNYLFSKNLGRSNELKLGRTGIHNKGIYLYQLLLDGQLIGKGKMIVQ